MTCSRNGVLSTGTMALGVLQVRGRNLVASPPVRIIAFIALCPRLLPVPNLYLYFTINLGGLRLST